MGDERFRRGGWLHRRALSFRYAGQGIVWLFRSQWNARLELAAGVLVIAAGAFFRIQPWEWAACLLCIGAVLTLEAVNTAIEAVVDLVSPQHHPLAGRAKDVAAGAVLLASLAACAVGGLIFLPKIWALLAQGATPLGW